MRASPLLEPTRYESVGCGDENFRSPKSSQGGSCLSLRSAYAVSKRSAEKKRFAYNALYYTCRHYLLLPSLRSARITIELAQEFSKRLSEISYLMRRVCTAARSSPIKEESIKRCSPLLFHVLCLSMAKDYFNITFLPLTM